MAPPALGEVSPTPKAMAGDREVRRQLERAQQAEKQQQALHNRKIRNQQAVKSKQEKLKQVGALLRLPNRHERG